MNYIPGIGFPAIPQATLSRAVFATLVALFLCSCSAPASESGTAAPASDRVYRVEYLLTPDPAGAAMDVELKLTQPRRLLRGFDMQLARIDTDSIRGDGEVTIDGDRVIWQPPAAGGNLRWTVPIDHIRAGDEFDAHMNPVWAIFRAADAMPSVRTRTLRGARSETTLTFRLPAGWSSLTPYFGQKNSYPINNPDRRFDRPSGWILLGKFGRRNERIAGRRVVVAGPTGHSVRRMDILALLRWTLPDLTGLLPNFPDRVTIISAGEPMWRGGLSAPTSIFMHADRPLLSENGTSTLLHEMMHVGIGLRAEDGADWIVEGLAEYYGLELLRRSGTISSKRHATALEELRNWGAEAKTLCSNNASGPVTALAVGVLDRLDRELRQTSDSNLDEVLGQLVTNDRDIGVAGLQSVATQLAGKLPDAIADKNLPGCGS